MAKSETIIVGEPELSMANQRTWAGVVHLSGIVLPIVGALVGFILLKNRGSFVRSQTATALNFQLSMALWLFAGTMLSCILMLALIGFVTIVLVPIAYGVLVFVFSIIAAVRATNGVDYRYPLSITFVS